MGSYVIPNLANACRVLALVAIIVMIVIAGVYPGPLLKLGGSETMTAVTTMLVP